MTKLQEMREAKKISQQELARRVGVAPPSVCSLERKGIYDTRTAQRYAKALDCTAIFLLEGLDKN